MSVVEQAHVDVVLEYVEQLLEDVVAHVVSVDALRLELPLQTPQLVHRGAQVLERARVEVRGRACCERVQRGQLEQLEEVVKGLHQVLQIH